MTFTLTGDLNEIDGRPSLTTDLTIEPVTDGGGSISDAAAKKIYDGGTVPLVGGRLVDRDSRAGVQLPDDSVFFWTDDAGVKQPGVYRVTRQYANGTGQWLVPAQPAGTTVDLSDPRFAESVDPVPVPPSVAARVRGVETGLAAEVTARGQAVAAAQQAAVTAAASDATSKAGAAQAAAVAAAAADATSKVAAEATARAQAITSAVNALVAAAPGALDTLQELADAMGDDPNFAATVNATIAARAPLASPALTGTPTVNGTPVATTTQAAGAAAGMALVFGG